MHLNELCHENIGNCQQIDWIMAQNIKRRNDRSQNDKLLVTYFRHCVNSREKPLANDGHRVFSPKSGLQNPTARRQRKSKQNNNFARESNVFVYFFVVFARLRREKCAVTWVHVRSIVLRKSRSRTAYNLQVSIFFLTTYCCYIKNSVQLKAEIFFECVSVCVSLYSGTVVIVMTRKMPRLPGMLKL